MKRRVFIAGLGSAAAWPVVARAQQTERVRLIGVLLPAAADDAQFQARFGASLQALALLGWTIGRNVWIDVRWATATAAEIRKHAAELAALAPDVILAAGPVSVGALLQATRTVPIVFVSLADPVDTGIVASLGRPGGNTTGFMNPEPAMSWKWLELLKKIAPGLNHVMVMVNAGNVGNAARLRVIEEAAQAGRISDIPRIHNHHHMIEEIGRAHV